MTREAYRVACLVTHPIQYQAPLFHYLSTRSGLDLEVLFLSRISLSGYYDPGFRAQVKWDVPLLDGYRYRFLPCVGANDRLSFWRPFTRKLQEALVRGNYDALWVHGYAHQAALRAIALARMAGIKVLLRGDSQLNFPERGYAKHLLKRLILPRLFAAVDGFLAVGSRNHAYYQHYGVPAERIFKMPYAIDNDSMQQTIRSAASGRAKLMSELGIEQRRPVILFASKLQRLKRPADVLEAFIQLSPDRRAEPEAYLVFVGDGEERGALEQRVRELGWNVVKFTGFKNQSELPAYFDLCDIFVLPSYYDAWGLVINEAMNAGKAIIASDRVGAVSDLLRDGVNGLVFPAGDVPALRRCLERLTKDQDVSRRMGAASLQRINQWNFAADYDGLVQALDFVTSTAPARAGASSHGWDAVNG